MSTVFDPKKLLEQIDAKMEIVTKRSEGVIPYTTENGRFIDCCEKHIGWWTNGFWGGVMWQLYSISGKEIYKKTAVFVEEQLDRALLDYKSMDHDSGFRWLPTAVIHNKIEPNEASYNRGRLAADNLLGRFNSKGGFIRAWNEEGDKTREGWAIIDCMMNLPLLFWAYEQTGDYRYYEGACRHANTAMKNFVREDGSCKHIVEFDAKTGEYIRNYGGQGFDEQSSWTRGQGWGIYGFTLAYMHTHNEEYLATARRIADYFISNIPENGIIPVDFSQPADVDYEDSAAAGIVSCGLIELAKITGESRYHDAAVKMITALAEGRLDLSADTDYLISNCTGAYHDKKHNFSMVYGDYYFIEALCKLAGVGEFIW